MNIIYFGSGQFGIDSLNAILNSKHKISLIVTQPSHPAGRGKKPRPTPVAKWAQKNNIEVIEAEKINQPGIIDTIAKRKPDLILVIAFGQMIGETLIDLPPKGIINVHGSLLPKYRGAGPVNWAILNGETKSGITIAAVTKKMDAGDIIATAQTDILPDDTADALYYKLANLAADPLIETLDKIQAGTASYTPQNPDEVTFAPKLKKNEGYIDFSEPADKLLLKIRGLWSWPGAAANYICSKTEKCRRVIFAKARVIETTNPDHLSCGALDKHLDIICGENAIRIITLKPAGRNLMNFRDFVNGHRTQPGDMFVKIDK